MKQGDMFTAMAPVYEVRRNGDDWRRLLTHIEVRRVQNGFIVMGFNAAIGPDYYTDEASRMSRVCFVCETVESLCATIQSLATEAGDFVWQAAVDLPITDLFKTVKGG